MAVCLKHKVNNCESNICCTLTIGTIAVGAAAITVFTTELYVCRGWDAGTADETADEDTATEGLNLDEWSKIQNPGFSDDDSSADE